MQPAGKASTIERRTSDHQDDGARIADYAGRLGVVEEATQEEGL